MPEELSPEEKMLAEAKAALEKGEKAHARDLLTRLVKIGKNNPRVWLLMSAAVETNKERIFCLNQALSIDPQNQHARRGLVALGALPPEGVQGVPLAVQKRNWESALFGGEGSETRAASRAFLRLGAVAAVGVIFIVVVVVLIASSRGPAAGPPVPVIRTYTPGPSVTAEATSSPVVRSPTPTFIGPTPLWMTLSETYTPTPLAVATLYPHPLYEAYRSAIIAYKNNDWPRTMNYLNQVATAQPGSPDILYLLGETARFQENYSEAISYYYEALNANPNFAPADLGLGRALLEANPTRPELALPSLEQAISLDPKYFEAYLELASAWIAVGNGEAALTALKTAASLDKSSPLLYFYRAQAELLTANPRAALVDAKLANSADITFLPAYRLVAEADRANDLVGDSLSPLEMYLRYVTDDEEAYLWLGQAELKNGDQNAAKRAFDQAIELDPGYFDARMARGLLYFSLKDYASAAEDFHMALQSNASSFEASLNWGRARLMNGDFLGAYEQLNAAFRLAQSDQEKAAVYYYRAQAMEGVENIPMAIQSWKLLLDLPTQDIDPAWLSQARERLQALYTPTPTLKSTLTPTVTRTRAASATATPSPRP